MAEHTPTPWTFRDVSGAGLEICAPVYKMAGIDMPYGMPEAPIHIFQFTSPQMIQISAERWVQFEPRGWSEMQAANAAFIVEAANNHDHLTRENEALRAALQTMLDTHGGLRISAAAQQAEAALALKEPSQ